jgi:hypothetical protein
VAFTADAQSVVLPDARTLNIGGPLFIINNAGTRTFGVRSGNPNQFTNADFAAATGWTAGTGWAIASGVATKTAGVQSDLTQAITTVVNTSYTVTFTITTVSAGTVQPVFSGGGADVTGTARSAPGTYTETITSNGNTAAGFRGSSTFAGSIDNVSITLSVPALLAVVPPGATAECSLTSATTIAGAWVVTGRGLDPALALGDVALSSTYTALPTNPSVALSSSISLHFARNASGHPLVYVVDLSSGAPVAGTPVLIVASNLNVLAAYAINYTKAMIILEGGVCYNITIAGLVPTVSSSVTAATFAGISTVVARITQMGANNDLFLAISTNGNVQAVDASGAAPVAGTAASAGTSVGFNYISRITSSTALVFFATGTSPWTINSRVASVSGTTVSFGTNVSISSVLSNGGGVIALTATSYIVSYYTTSSTTMNAVSLTVSGTTATFGTPLVIETTADLSGSTFATFSGNTRQPAFFGLSTTTGLLAYSGTSLVSRHVVLTLSGTTITAGSILYGVWRDDTPGGHFAPEADGVLAYWSNGVASPSADYGRSILSLRVSGTAVVVEGVSSPNGFNPNQIESGRFKLSGGIYGIRQGGNSGVLSALTFGQAFNLFKRNIGGPTFLGTISVNTDVINQARPPVEMSAFRVAIPALSSNQVSTATASVRTSFWEFPA